MWFDVPHLSVHERAARYSGPHSDLETEVIVVVIECQADEYRCDHHSSVYPRIVLRDVTARREVTYHLPHQYCLYNPVSDIMIS